MDYNGLSGYLTTIIDDAENNFVTSVAGSTTAVWIGATSEISYVNPLLAPDEQYSSETALRGVYHWGAGPEAGALITYRPWFDGEPNGTATDRCLLTSWHVPTGRWNDAHCNGAGADASLLAASGVVAFTLGSALLLARRARRGNAAAR